MPMAAIPLAIGAATAAAGGIASAAGVGKNNAKTTAFGDTKAYNSNAFQYGGREGGAADASQAYGMMANQAGDRRFDLQQADQYAQMGMAARGGQDQAAQLMLARANGQTPSIAGMQANMDAQRLMAQQASLGASARGAAGLAMANQAAMNNTANGMGLISQQAQINAANERMQAEAGAAQAFGGLRGADAQGQQMAAQQVFQGQQMNDAQQLGLLAGQRDVNNNQLTAQIQGQQMLANSHDGNQARYQQRMQQNADTGMKFFQGGVSAVQSGISGATGGMGGGK